MADTSSSTPTVSELYPSNPKPQVSGARPPPESTGFPLSPSMSQSTFGREFSNNNYHGNYSHFWSKSSITSPMLLLFPLPGSPSWTEKFLIIAKFKCQNAPTPKGLEDFLKIVWSILGYICLLPSSLLSSCWQELLALLPILTPHPYCPPLHASQDLAQQESSTHVVS